jgi:hypothetical protein
MAGRISYVAGSRRVLAASEPSPWRRWISVRRTTRSALNRPAALSPQLPAQCPDGRVLTGGRHRRHFTINCEDSPAERRRPAAAQPGSCPATCHQPPDCNSPRPVPLSTSGRLYVLSATPLRHRRLRLGPPDHSRPHHPAQRRGGPGAEGSAGPLHHFLQRASGSCGHPGHRYRRRHLPEAQCSAATYLAE